MEIVKGVPINPELPENFDSEDIETRDHDEFIEWIDRPYILRTTWSDEKARVIAADEFMAAKGEPYERDWAAFKARFFKINPSGTEYQVRCLTGGAWDRSSFLGSFDNLEEAIQCAKTGPNRKPTL